MISKTKTGIANAGIMFGINDTWKTNLFTDKNKSDLNKFIEEINTENNTRMCYQNDLIEVNELKPTYEQISQDKITDQSMKNVLVMKSLESVLEVREQAFKKFLDSVQKSKTVFDNLSETDGSIRQALDSLFVFVEQELQQARQQLSLHELKEFIADFKTKAHRSMNNYLQGIKEAEKDVIQAEKNLSKSKETLQKLLQQQKKGDRDIFETTSSKMNSFFSSAQPPPSSPPQTGWATNEENKSERQKEMEDLITKQEKEIDENVRELLTTLGQRDQIYAATRRAFQQLNKDCKLVILTTLNKIVEREKESLIARQHAVNKLEESVKAINIELDEDEFIQSHMGEYSNHGELVLHSQALSMLGNTHILDRQTQEYSTRNSLIEANKSTSNSNTNTTTTATTTAESGPIEESLKTGIDQMEQTVQNLSQIFYLTEFNFEKITPTSTPSEILRTLRIDLPSPRRSTTQLQTISEPNLIIEETNPSDSETQNSPSPASQTTTTTITMTTTTTRAIGPTENKTAVEEAVCKLCKLSDTIEGRKQLVNVLNQFRSKKVDVGLGFNFLGAVVWCLLSKCSAFNDVHNAKIVMILSQTFFRLVDLENTEEKTTSETVQPSTTESQEDETDSNGDENEKNNFRLNEIGKRRQFLKEIIISHPLWQEGRFWEQALWQCVLEQLQMIQYGTLWHDMNGPNERNEAVNRVHDIIFSQVMAIAHSMIELGCRKSHAREFVYRMCVIHQLNERQRQQLLTHLIRHEDGN